MAEILRKLGRYELLRRIAIGGMGEIFLARAHGTAGFTKRVIIKTILPHLAEEDEFITKFLDEGHILVQLTHGNIVPVIDMNEVDGEYYIAMEYIAGRDLREVTKRLASRGQVMPIDMALYLVSELCKGLSYAHRKTDDDGQPLELVHRDISPSNVLLSSEGEVKIIDFGIARATTKASRTVSGRIQGKFCYMSPEQASGKPLDHRSDIFSTGVVLYELLTGMRPFEGNSDLESLELVRACEPDPPSTLNPQIPEAIDELVGRALARSPFQRFDTCDELGAGLLQYLYAEGSPPSSQDVVAFLEGLFPEGVERRELRSSTGSRSAPIPGQPMSLEDALEQELALLEGGGNIHTPSSPKIDPLTATAVSAEAPAPPAHHTATLAPMVSIKERTPVPRDPVTPSEPLEVEEEEEPAVEEEVQEAQLEPVPEAEPRRPLRGALLLGAVLLTAGVGAALGVALWPGQPPNREVRFETKPDGASLYLDGALVTGQTTPATLSLQAGSYNVRFDREGFESSGELLLKVSPGASVVAFPKAPFALRKKKESATVVLRSEPSGAEIVIHGEVVGKTPAPVTLVDGQLQYIKLKHPRCKAQVFELKGSGAPGVLKLSDCAQASADIKEPTPPKTDPPKKDPPRLLKQKKATLRVSTTPRDAALYINDKRQRFNPVTLRGLPQTTTLKIRATAPGYEERTVRTTPRRAGGSVNVTLTPSAQGCFSVRFDKAPFLAHVELDGKRLSGKDRSGMSRRQDLRKRKVSAGPHTLKVWNDLANKAPIITKFKVDAGTSCTTIDAWSGKVTR